MPRELDPSWKHVQRGENGKWKCKFCSTESHGSATRIRAHLAGIPGYGIKVCMEVKDAVRTEALETFKGKGSGLDKSTGGTSGKGTEGTVFGASRSVLPSEGASNPDDTQNSNQHGCAPQQQSFYRPTGTGTAPACPQDQVSLPPSDMPLDNLDNTQQSDPSNHWLDAAHGNENTSSLQPLSSLYIGEPPALPELSTLLDFGTGAAPACPQYEVSLPREDKSTGGTSGEGTEGTDAQNSNQLGCAPQQPSFYSTTGTGTAPACPQEQGSLPPSDMLLDNLDTSQQPNLSNHWLDAALGYEIAPPVQPLSSLYISEPSALTELYTHLEFGGDVLPTPLLSNITTTGIPQYSDEQYLSFDEQSANGVTLDALLYSTENLHNSLPENLRESRDVDVSTFEEIQMNEVHNPTGGSSLQIDSSLDVDRANRLQDCGQPCAVEVAPVRSNTSPTDTVQHPCQLPQRCDKEDGNDTRRFPSRTLMNIDPSIASQHTSVLHSLVPEASTNKIGPSSSRASVPRQRQIVPRQSIKHQSINLKTTHQDPTVPSSSSWKSPSVTSHSQALMDMDSCMPSSSQAQNNAPPPSHILPCGTDLTGLSSLPELDMNEGAPMTSHPNTGNNFEENRALKRKLELLYSKEAIIREELDFAASLSLKEPRLEVVNLLASVEKLKNDCPEATSEDCLPPHQQVDILMHEVGDLMRPDRGLFEVRETKVGKLLEEKMTGEAFWRNTTKILEFLVGNQISRLGIYGMGGVGKTTIMVHIHNRLLEEANYGNVLWITVSHNFNTQRLQDDLWKVLGMGKLQENDVKKRAAMLCNVLKERGKSTIILDDVWERFDVNEVGIPIKANGIKLVLTTRSFEVCRQMQSQEMIKIEPLSHIEAESLFLEELGYEETLNLETKATVKSIVNECAGLPLAVITMARSMRGVTDVCEWKDCLKKLRDSDMEQTDMEKVVLKKLEFSYNRLGNHEIQQCFLSCALYPEDELIDKFELIEFFIDQGLFGQLETREEQYCRGHTILNKLANVCLLEDHGRKMKMHDLIRDMALHIMSATSIVKAGKGLKRIPSEEYWTDALEKVSLMESNIEGFPLNMSPDCPKLSTFLFNKSSFYDVISTDPFFKQLWGLKVLNLSVCSLRELPNSISDLVNLRALLLKYCWRLRRIPYLGKLKSLRKLDIFGCVEVEALEGLEMLVNLRFLNLSRTGIKRLPKGTLGNLLNLQYLKVEAGSGEDITKLGALETLKCSFEDVDDFSKFVRAVRKQRNNPHHYELYVRPEQPKIDEIISEEALLQNCERSVHIETRSHAIVSVGGESSGGGICILIPQDVQKLTASNCDGTTNLFDVGPLENLEELKIFKWKNLRGLCGGQDEETIDIHDSPGPTPTPLIFPSLRELIISECPKLKYLFGHGPIFYLPHLRMIGIYYCSELVGITVAVTSPHPHLPPAFPSLEYIIVRDCEKMKRVMESNWLPHFCNLRTIDILYCENMKEIIGGPPPCMPVEEISLEMLLIGRCRNLRRLFSYELLIHLQNLQIIEVRDCYRIVEMISRAGRGQEGSITTLVNNTSSSSSSSESSISLPKLNRLVLCSLPQLKSICEVPISCDSMEDLVVEKCPKLNKIHLQLQLRDIENLPYIKVDRKKILKMLIWDHPDAQAIIQSNLHFCGGFYILESRDSYWWESECELWKSESESSDADFEEV